MTAGTLLSGLGPFFDVGFHGDDLPVAPWRPLAEVLDDGPVLRDRVAYVRRFLAQGGGQPDEAVEPRVAASVTHLGMVARLCSPVLAVAAGSGEVLDLDGSWWQPVVGGAVPLSVPERHTRVPDDLAAAVCTSLVDGPLRRLDTAIARFSVSSHVRWGNVASALNGATTMLTTARPEWTTRVRALTAALYAVPPLRGTAATVNGRFRRNSCCLIYRAAPGHAGPKCGDCVLTAGQESGPR
ncbi:(2Fe-2S)-binding protein [Actinophytocola oryzae]|uniref:FhuF-like iron-sulfur protein n=1 Tax=Actinophytocola oryzae TaxID=502181 RepID=A0A4V3FRD3_9PSEU|nr:(2Fe-2S)-binding protein [Actinophytocola oryzae]TDV43101.1 FhuF-like iron-sulfur protein [Actinophytocola oryzae]